MKKYIVECLGTFALTLAVALSLSGSFPVSTPVLAGLVVLLFVYSIGHISGTHLNPAVTLGLWSIKKINSTDALSYIVAQFVGAGLALMVSNRVGDPLELIVSNYWTVGFAELLGAFFFTFGIASVVYGRVQNNFGGLVIGGSLVLGIAFAALLGSNGVLNPAVAFGIGSFGLMYVLGPILGSIIGMQAYRALENQ